MNRQQTSSINIRNFIGTESRRTSRPLSVISMLPRADASGLQASTVTYFVLSVSCAIRDHSRSEISDAYGQRPETSRYNVSKNVEGDSQWICLADLVLSSLEHSG